MYRIKALREDRDLPQKAIAELLDLTQQQYSNIENEKTDITGARVVLLAKYYNVSADYILGLTQEQKQLK